jgi:dipeptidase
MLRIALTVLALSLTLIAPRAHACTNYIVTRGASADGSVLITYSADSHTLYGQLDYLPPGEHGPGELIDVIEWDTGKFLTRIPQAPRTHAVVGLMNEHQVAIGETTFGCRPELQDPKGTMDYGSLMRLTLQRAHTAREAVELMGALSADHGWVSDGGETYSVADPNEVWLMEMVGKGKAHKGTVWVALRVPDGYVTAHANSSRIRQFPLNDKKNCLYAPDVISFARDQGWFSGQDQDFSFRDAYVTPSFGDLRFCEARVWRFLDLVAPSLKLPLERVLGLEGQPPLPLWAKPDRKLGLRDVMGLMRDHFEGTPLDLSQGVGAGPFHLPYRWRPLEWKLGEGKYLNERAVSTQQTGFSFVAQLRASLPGSIGGVLWFGVDDTFQTVYLPMYACLTSAPRPFAAGTADFKRFSWESAFWVFNAVSNLVYTRWQDMIPEVLAEQQQLEGSFLARQEEVEQAALTLYKQSPRLAADYLTRYAHEQSELTLTRWRALWERLFVRFLDGNVRDSLGVVQHPPLPEDWLRAIVKERPEDLKVRKLPGEVEEGH